MGDSLSFTDTDRALRLSDNFRDYAALPKGHATSFGKDAVTRDEWPSFLRVNECERRSGASKRKRAIG